MSGLWIDGKSSKEEMGLLQSLIKKAAEKFPVAITFENEKLVFKSWARGTTLSTFYSWKFPPQQFWVKEKRGPEECLKCLPNGPDGVAGREVWCEKIEYNFAQCPYGVPTIKRAH